VDNKNTEWIRRNPPKKVAPQEYDQLSEEEVCLLSELSSTALKSSTD
jgi:hypothetical protein